MNNLLPISSVAKSGGRRTLRTYIGISGALTLHTVQTASLGHSTVVTSDWD